MEGLFSGTPWTDRWCRGGGGGGGGDIVVKEEGCEGGGIIRMVFGHSSTGDVIAGYRF